MVFIQIKIIITLINKDYKFDDGLEQLSTFLKLNLKIYGKTLALLLPMLMIEENCYPKQIVL